MNHSQLDPLPTDLPFEIISQTIGRGAYASVKLGKIAATQEVFAVKFIHKRHASEMARISLSQLNQEIALHKHCGTHANLIQYFESGDDSIWMWIAMEYASGGELFDKIEADVGLPEDISHFYFTQLVAGVSYIHGRGIAHRDIKPENILLDGNGNLKVADFGLAVLFQYKGEHKLSKTVCGSPPYVAPEVINGAYRADIVDIWSCAVVLFVLLAGNTPWDEPTQRSLEFEEFVRLNGRPDYEPWPKIPSGVISLLRGMMKLDPNTRFTFDDIRRHPWFTRDNHYLARDGRCQDGVNLATKMMEALHIDFNDMPSNDGEELPVRFASTQPITPVGDAPFEWERPPNHFASQPVKVPEEFNSQDLWASLADDPTMSQFAPRPHLSLSLTQNARRFNDIAPSKRLTRFYSSYSFRQILPILSGALHRLGVVIQSFKESDYWESSQETWIPIKTEDSRKCLLRGDIIVERLAQDMLLVTFSKNVGDPLEWRRFFKRVTVLSKEAIFTGN